MSCVGGDWEKLMARDRESQDSLVARSACTDELDAMSVTGTSAFSPTAATGSMLAPTEEIPFDHTLRASSSTDKLYAEFCAASDAYFKERDQKFEINRMLVTLTRELELKAPAIKRQGVQFEALSASHTHLEDRLREAAADLGHAEDDRADLEDRVRRLGGRAEALRRQNGDLGKQVQRLVAARET
eukprot:363412_1